MKKIFLSAGLVVVMASLSFAADAATASSVAVSSAASSAVTAVPTIPTIPTTSTTSTTSTAPTVTGADEANMVTIKGDIIDQAGDLSKPDVLAAFVKDNPKSSVVKNNEGGFVAVIDGKVAQFTAPSNTRIWEFLGAGGSKLHIEVTAKKSGEMLELLTIKSQE